MRKVMKQGLVHTHGLLMGRQRAVPMGLFGVVGLFLCVELQHVIPTGLFGAVGLFLCVELRHIIIFFNLLTSCCADKLLLLLLEPKLQLVLLL